MQHLAELALQSPVLVALIGLVGLFVGRQVLQAQVVALKDAHAAEMKAKDAEIAALERLTSAKMMEQLEPMKQFWELRVEQQAAEVEATKAKLDEHRNLTAREREQLQAELAQRQADLELSERLLADRAKEWAELFQGLREVLRESP